MKPIIAIGGGLAGACAATLLHETVKRIIPEAPRLDLLGMNAISKGSKTKNRKKLFALALAGDILTNSLYYSLSGVGKEKNLWVKSSLLGLAAGLSAVVMPGPLGLNEKHTNKKITTKIITVGLYIAGAIVTTAMMKLLEKRKQKRHKVWEQKLVTSAMV